MHNFTKNLQGRHFVVGGLKNFKLLPDISFDSDFQKVVLSNLLFLCAFYQGDLDDIQWNEVTTWTASNFNNSWYLYILHFSNIINPNIWFIKNPKCQQFLFWRKSGQNNRNFSFFKGPLFRKGSFYWYEYWRVLREFFGLSQSYANVNVKVGQNLTALKNRHVFFSVFQLDITCKNL